MTTRRKDNQPYETTKAYLIPQGRATRTTTITRANSLCFTCRAYAYISDRAATECTVAAPVAAPRRDVATQSKPWSGRRCRVAEACLGQRCGRAAAGSRSGGPNGDPNVRAGAKGPFYRIFRISSASNSSRPALFSLHRDYSTNVNNCRHWQFIR